MSCFVRLCRLAHRFSCSAGIRRRRSAFGTSCHVPCRRCSIGACLPWRRWRPSSHARPSGSTSAFRVPACVDADRRPRLARPSSRPSLWPRASARACRRARVQRHADRCERGCTESAGSSITGHEKVSYGIGLDPAPVRPVTRDPVDDLLAELQMALGQTTCCCKFEHGTHSPGHCERRATAIIGIAALCPDCEQAWRRPCSDEDS